MSAASATPASATCSPPLAPSTRLLKPARAATSSEITASSAPGQGNGASRGNDASCPSSRNENVNAAPTEPGLRLSAASASKVSRRPGVAEAVSCSWLKAWSVSVRDGWPCGWPKNRLHSSVYATRSAALAERTRAPSRGALGLASDDVSLSVASVQTRGRPTLHDRVQWWRPRGLGERWRGGGADGAMLRAARAAALRGPRGPRRGYGLVAKLTVM